ncbi:efflux RND transporter periplasmic adaptor subunit [Amaricoccus sp.]|uniref:efflux RND transporter periplasmic adaptor subunit n=1 Tax=Amaricoccus sp. TaxID=1872485 RepID=UPI001B653EF9|nr:efflux RND transporter periplasmic adaptor subunit [Amaricoccus sp.]MBP7002878.1 efflux RND transporter periplasmic adaptor subunit [Amaricoccus sp.]
MRLILLPALLLLALAPAARASDDAAPALAEAGAPAITVSTVATAHLVDRVRGSGMIGPVEQVLVSPQIEGQAIESIEVEVGDWVEAGQVMARLSDAALQLQHSQLEASRATAEATIAQGEAQLAEAEALRDEALRDRDRAVSLAARGAASGAAADTARSTAAAAAARMNAAAQGLNAARAQLRLVDAQLADIDLQLRRTAVAAPVAGRVTERDATIGAIASMAGEPLFAIVRDGALELRADVAEQDLLKLAPGQKAQLGIVGLAGPVGGEIRLVEPTVNETSRLGRVRIAIDDSARVRSGMFADAEIRVREAEALAVPISAVNDGAVLRVTGDVLESARIVTGIRDGGLVEVVDGLAAGDVVVTKAGAFVRPGDRINPVPAAATAAPTAEARP